MAGAVHVEGLTELVRGLGRMDRGLRREMQRELRDIGELVSREARLIAAAKGLHGGDGDPHPGQLIDQIRLRLRLGVVAVVDPAKTVSRGYPSGFNYPRRFEFEAGGARAFLRPALEAESGEVERKMASMIDRLASEGGFNRGGAL